MIRFLPLLAVLATGCGPLPRDVEGTSEGIARRGYARVGISSDAALPRERERIATMLARLGTRARIERAPAEVLLTRLEDGELDLVLIATAKNNPWKTCVTFGPALIEARSGRQAHELRPAMMNGENAWIGRVHRAAVAIGGTP